MRNLTIAIAVSLLVCSRLRAGVTGVVVDAATGKAVGDYSFIRRDGQRPGQSIWQQHTVKHVRDGPFAIEDQRLWDATQIRFWADGYRPVVVDVKRGRDADLVIKLERDAGLHGKVVTVDGKPAFMNYVSPSQVTVQAPADLTAGGMAAVVVSYGGQSSAPAMLAIKGTAGGLLAPPIFNVNGKQYAAAIHLATGGFVTNRGFPYVGGAPAASGETLVFLGIGFGPVTPGTVAGQIAKRETAVTTVVQFQFGDIQAQVLQASLVPELVGVYQFNVVTPAGLPSGDVSLKVLVGGEPIQQALFVPVE